MRDVSRRNFFKLVSSAVAIAAAPVKFIASKLSFSDIITYTLRNEKFKQTLVDNISRNNALLQRLKAK